MAFDYGPLIIPAIIGVVAIVFGWITSDKYRAGKLKQAKTVIHELTDTVVVAGTTLQDFDAAMADDKISEQEAEKLLEDLKAEYAAMLALKDAVIALIGPSAADLQRAAAQKK